MTAQVGDYVSAYRLGTVHPVSGVLIEKSDDRRCFVATVRMNYFSPKPELVTDTVAAEYPHKKSEEWLPDYERGFVSMVRSELSQIAMERAYPNIPPEECCDHSTNEETVSDCSDQELAKFEEFHAKRVSQLERDERPTQEEMDDLLPPEEDGTFVGGSFYTWEEYKEILR